MGELSKEEAIEMYDSGWWKEATDNTIVAFQLFEDRLCLPFDEFHRAIEEVLRRPVYTHEFAFKEELQKEYLTQRPPMALGESLGILQEKYPHLKIIGVDVSHQE